MKTLWNALSFLATIIWSVAVLLWVVLILPFSAILVPTGDIMGILHTGYTTITGGLEMFMAISLIISLTMLVPPFRRCFRIFPWLYPYVKILSVDMPVLAIAAELLNYGYDIYSEERHRIFILLMIGEIVAGRLMMCWYFHKKPAGFRRENDGQ